MAVFMSTAYTVTQMLQDIVAFLTDSENFPGSNAWELISPTVPNFQSTEFILKGVGDGSDEIYVGMRLYRHSASQENIQLNGFAGYDPGLEWYEQPGAINLDSLPCVPLAKDTLMTYWVTANTRRFMFQVEMSNQYEGAYLGFMNPIAIERQYPYPLIIGGSAYTGMNWENHGTAHSLFINPVFSGGKSSLCYRRPDGDWRYGGDRSSVWPTDTAPCDTFTIYKKSEILNQMEDNMLFPTILYETEPVGMLGEFDGVYWVGNRCDLAAKDHVVYKDVTYKVFNNVYNRDDDAYHVMRWV